jgi:hypothetical protein
MDSGVVGCLVSSSISFGFTGEFSPNFDLKKIRFRPIQTSRVFFKDFVT